MNIEETNTPKLVSISFPVPTPYGYVRFNAKYKNSVVKAARFSIIFNGKAYYHTIVKNLDISQIIKLSNAFAAKVAATQGVELLDKVNIMDMVLFVIHRQDGPIKARDIIVQVKTLAVIKQIKPPGEQVIRNTLTKLLKSQKISQPIRGWYLAKSYNYA